MKLICVACNTVSSVALPVIRNHFKVPIVGVLLPGAREAVYATRNKRIGVIGTRGTIKSGAYENEIKHLDPSVRVFSQACPLFVPFVEEGWLVGKTVKEVADTYLGPLKKAKTDTVILGCTHYPLLKPVIKEVLGEDVVLIDSAKQVSVEVKNILSENNMLNTNRRGSPATNKTGKRRFYVSDNAEWFSEIAKRFMGEPIGRVVRVNNV